MKTKNMLLSIVGPTASGKSDLALKLAAYFKTSIISADSRQFYRELNTGTAKPTKEELKRIPHHFINSHAITEEFNAGDFEKSALGLMNDLFKEHEILIMVGGSGLFCKAIWEGLDELPIIDPGLRSAINEEVSKNGLVPLLAELFLKMILFISIKWTSKIRCVLKELLRSFAVPANLSVLFMVKLKHLGLLKI